MPSRAYPCFFVGSEKIEFFCVYLRLVMTKVARVVAAIAVGFFIAGCAGSEYPEPEPIVYNFVTYESTAADGTESVFTYQVNGDSPLVTLTANWRPAEPISTGTRLLLSYIPESGTTESGPVSVQGYIVLPGGEVRIDEPTGESEPMRLNSMWRSGSYLNLDGVVSFSGPASEISLYAEPGSEGSAEPRLNVIVRKSDEGSGVAAERRLYASWDISSLWSRADVEALSVAYTDTENETSIMRFIKQ